MERAALNSRFQKVIQRLPQRLAIALAISTFALTACAPNTEDLRTASVVQGSIPSFPTSGVTSAASLSISLIDILSGSYSTTLVGRNASTGATSTQPMTVTIRKVTAAQTGEAWLYGVFSSSGPLGTVSFETFLGLGLSGLYNTYSLTTPALSLSGLSSSALSFELVLRLNSGATKVDPTQSGIFVKDCGFAQYLGCGTMAEDVWFADNRLSKL